MFREYRDKYNWSVVPLRPDGSKKAAAKWEQYQWRRPSDAEIGDMEKSIGVYRPEAQVAVITGVISNLVVVDVDSEDEWDVVSGFPIPETITAWTTPPWPEGRREQVPRGKVHFYFQHPGPEWWVTSSVHLKALGGCDIRADGAYVAAPPSFHEPDLILRPLLPEGWRRVWGNDPKEYQAAPLPQWLRDKIKIQRRTPYEVQGSKPAKTSVAISPTDLLPADPDMHWLGEAFMGVDQGARDTTAARLAGYFLGLKLPKEHVLAILQAWNTRNNPPLPVKGKEGLEKIVKSIAQAEARQAPPLVKIDPDVPLADQRPVMLDEINQHLQLTDGNKIIKIEKYKGEDPDYTFLFASGNEAIVSPAQLVSQSQARVAFLGQADKMIPRIGSRKDPYAWDGIVDLIDKTAVQVHVGRDATAKGALANAIERYLANNQPDAVTNKDPAPEDEPFIFRGQVHIFLHSLAKYLFMNQFQRLSIQMLARHLKSLGWSNTNLRFGEARCRAWAAPLSYQIPTKEPRRQIEPGNIVPFRAPDVP